MQLQYLSCALVFACATGNYRTYIASCLSNSGDHSNNTFCAVAFGGGGFCELWVIVDDVGIGQVLATCSSVVLPEKEHTGATFHK